MVRPSFFIRLFTAVMGAKNKSRGSVAPVAYAVMRPSTSSPCVSAYSSVVTIVAAPPSLSELALPAVTVPSLPFSNSGFRAPGVPALGGLRREHPGFPPRAAALVHGEGTAGGRTARLERGLASRRLADPGLDHVAHDDFVDVRRWHSRAFERRPDGDGAELRRGQGSESAEKLPDGRPRGGDDHWDARFIGHEARPEVH